MKLIFPFSILILLVPFYANALEPERSNEVSKVTIAIPEAYSIDKETAFVGIEGCKKLVENNNFINVTFETQTDPVLDKTFIDNYYYFKQNRGLPTKIDCNSGDLCAIINRDKIEFEANKVKIKLDFKTLSGLDKATECNAFDTEFFVRMTTLLDTVKNSNDARVIVDTIRPPSPSNLEAEVTEGTIRVTFVAPSNQKDVKEYIVYYSYEPFAEGELPPASAKKSTIKKENAKVSISVDLEANKTLYLGITSSDEAGNTSLVSNVIQKGVIETQGFWDVYQEAGGEEDGGCSSTSSSSSWFFIFGFLIFVFKIPQRKKKIKTTKNTFSISMFTMFLFIIASTLVTSNANAESSIWGSAEVKIGSIYPSLDKEFGDTGPYSKTFGENILVGELEIDAHLISNPIFLLGVGMSMGYGSVSGDAKAKDGAKTDDKTSLSIMPFRASAVARLTFLVTKFNIPFVPTAKVGIDSYHWSINDTKGDTVNANGKEGSGWKTGWHAGLGLHFLLNSIAPGMASNFDFQWGVNRSYFFGEYMITKIDGFGDPGFDFSDNYWNFGLAFDF